MYVNYPLKKTNPTNFTDSLVSYIEEAYNSETAFTFRPVLGKINELRNKMAIQISQPITSDMDIDKSIDITSAYTKYCLLLLKRFNWNSQKGNCVQGVNFVWFDSFQKVESSKHTIAFDVFCCYYNLAVLYFMRAAKLSQVELDSSRQDAINKAKAAAYVLKEMRQKFQGEFANCGFHDTKPAHLAILQDLCFGVIYKSLYNTFKSNQYKVGINKLASLASTTNKYFYKAFGTASGYFTNQPSGVTDQIKKQLLSMAFAESFYFDVICNVKLAKYYSNLIETQQDKFPLVIGYQKKALRIMELVFGNSNVQQLLNSNPQKKKELLMLKDQLKVNIEKDISRNAQIYKQPEISEQLLPPAEEIPANLSVTLVTPANLNMQNEGQFSKLMSTESTQLALELSNFAKSRKTLLDASYKKLNDQVSKVFMDTGVSFYLDEVDSGIRPLPGSVKVKIAEINSLGGRQKLQGAFRSIVQFKDNTKQTIKQLRLALDKEEAWDHEKRTIYKEKWARASSDSLNAQYYGKLQLIEGRLQAASGVDQKLVGKYKKNQVYISVLDQPEQQIALVVPKLQSKPSQQNIQNAEHIQKLRHTVEKIKGYAQQIDTVTSQIGDFLSKTNYTLIASETVGKQKSKEQVFKETFTPLEKQIYQFNMHCKIIKEQVQQAASIAVYLNKANQNSQNMQASKIQHDTVLVFFNQIFSLFANFQQSKGFYDKVNDHLVKLKADILEFVRNRETTGKQLEDKIKGKGEPGGGTSKIAEFPSIYPNNSFEFNYSVFQYNPKKEPQPLPIHSPIPSSVPSPNPNQPIDFLSGSVINSNTGPTTTQTPSGMFSDSTKPLQNASNADLVAQFYNSFNPGFIGGPGQSKQ